MSDQEANVSEVVAATTEQQPAEKNKKEESTAAATTADVPETGNQLKQDEEPVTDTAGNDEPVKVDDTQKVDESAEPTQESTATTEPAEQCEEPPKRRSVFQNRALHEYEWKPTGETRAVVYICHGLHEHMGRYEKLIEQLTENGMLVRGIDMVGHGRSEGDRGHIDSHESYITDVVNHIKDTKEEFNDVPLFLMGHSNGGLVSIGVTLRVQDMLQGAVYSAPSIAVDASFVSQLGAKIVAFFSPTTGVMTLDSNTISSVPEEVQAYNEDPLNYRGKTKASFAASLLKAVDVYRPRLPEISLPVLIIHGTDDNLVPLSASVVTYDNVTSTDKTFMRFEGSRHEILHDKEQEMARDFICQWILNRLAGPVPPNTNLEEDTTTATSPTTTTTDDQPTSTPTTTADEPTSTPTTTTTTADEPTSTPTTTTTTDDQPTSTPTTTTTTADEPSEQVVQKESEQTTESDTTPTSEQQQVTEEVKEAADQEQSTSTVETDKQTEQ